MLVQNTPDVVLRDANFSASNGPVQVEYPLGGGLSRASRMLFSVDCVYSEGLPGRGLSCSPFSPAWWKRRLRGANPDRPVRSHLFRLRMDVKIRGISLLSTYDILFIIYLHKLNGGEGGIRTPGRDKPYNGFRGRRFQPLSHLSKKRFLQEVTSPESKEQKNQSCDANSRIREASRTSSMRAEIFKKPLDQFLALGTSNAAGHFDAVIQPFIPNDIE